MEEKKEDEPIEGKLFYLIISYKIWRRNKNYEID